MSHLRALTNFKNEADLQIAVGWLIAALFPQGPFSLLALCGENGTAKSVTGEILRGLIDPVKGPLRRPASEADLLIMALHSRVVVYDNLSHMKTDMADALCSLTGGTAMSTRKKYHDTDEIIVAVTRPVMITSIENLLTRPDLAERTYTMVLPPIPAERRQMKTRMLERFAAAAPGILALLLDGVATALKNLSTVDEAGLPRTADFAAIAIAAAPACGWKPAVVAETIRRHRVDAIWP